MMHRTTRRQVQRQFTTDVSLAGGIVVSESRVIKKYPNRRLYDTEVSRYITIADLKKLIIDGIDLEVIDASSGNNITRTVLLQIITEQEAGQDPLFSTDVLTQMIRNYGSSTHDVFSNYVSQSMELFVSNQRKLQQQFSEMVPENAVDTLSDLTRRNLEIWKNVQDSFLQTAGLTKPTKKDDS